MHREVGKAIKMCIKTKHASHFVGSEPVEGFSECLCPHIYAHLFV